MRSYHAAAALAALVSAEIVDDNGVQWQHLLRIHDRSKIASKGAAAERRMEIDGMYARVLSRWIPRRGRPQRRREKNWVPFVWRGQLYVEYSLEPRLVLSVNPNTGLGTPVFPLTSSRAMSAWVEKLGPVSGGTPAVELAGHGIFLALAHVKLFKKKGPRTATSRMLYKHFWYAFEARPPFALLSCRTKSASVRRSSWLAGCGAAEHDAAAGTAAATPGAAAAATAAAAASAAAAATPAARVQSAVAPAVFTADDA